MASTFHSSEAQLQASKPKTKLSKRDISPSRYQKPCDLCHALNDVLIRCRTDETLKWHFVCPAKCWKRVSGGEIDGPDYPYYTYGGIWKNKHAAVSGKKTKGNKSSTLPRKWSAACVGYATNDKVDYEGANWVCRRSHKSNEKTKPSVSYTYWKEAIR